MNLFLKTVELLPLFISQGFDGELNSGTIEKIQYDAIDDDAIEHLKKPNYVNLMKVAIENSDAVILGSTEIPEELEGFIKKMAIPVLKYHNMDDFSQAYLDFCREKVLQ